MTVAAGAEPRCLVQRESDPGDLLVRELHDSGD
jgi:hypothetical protein